MSPLIVCSIFSVGTKHPKVHLCDLKSGSKIHVLQGQWTRPQHINIFQHYFLFWSTSSVGRTQSGGPVCAVVAQIRAHPRHCQVGLGLGYTHSLKQQHSHYKVKVLLFYLPVVLVTSHQPRVKCAATTTHANCAIAQCGYSPHLFYATLHMIINHLGLACCGPRGPKTIL